VHLRSIARLFEPSQIGRRLASPCRHQEAIAAQEIVLLADPNLMFVFTANRFQPLRGLADIFRLMVHGDVSALSITVISLCMRSRWFGRDRDAP